MPAPTAWRPLESYPAFMQPIVRFMWTQLPPLNPSQFASRAGVRRQLLSAYLNSSAEATIAPDPDVVRRFARAMGRPTSELMALAGHGDEADPFLDRVEAVDFVLAELAQITAMGEIDQEQLEACQSALERLRQHEAQAIQDLQQ